MRIEIEHRERDFNVSLATKEEPFITIKGCRVVDGSKGRFVSWPAKKLDSGKYWNHVWASEAFQAAILEAYDASQPKQQPNRRQREEDDLPF